MTIEFIIGMLLLGLGTSLHCVSMCGPLVLTYAVKGTEDGPWYHKITPNAAYQGAKVVSYMLVGLLLGAVGSFFNIDALRPYVYYLAGVFMIVLGLGMTGYVPWAARFTPRPPRFLMNMLMKLRRKSAADADAGENTLATPVFFGLMTGLLPCGPLMAAQVSAATSGSAAAGALGMAAFAVGTAPLMVAFGTAGSLIPRAWKDRMMLVLAIGVILFGAVFINRGLMATGAPVNFDTVKLALLGGPSVDANAEYTTGADGVVEVPLVIENVKFVPSTVQIPADKPVRLIIDRREDNYCSSQLYLPQLGILKDLAPNGTTIVDIPATPAGTYTLTCGMSMMGGSLVAGGAAQGVNPFAWLGLALAASAGVLYISQRRDAARQAAEEAARTKDGRGPRGAGGRTAGAPKGRNVRPVPAPEGATLVLGFKPNEILVIGIALAGAILAGLVFGGYFAS